ncbi:hypothetical protein OMK64_13385 [Cellulomonas fimi]|uniref:hypothetical protein n=1 Tax=Cellulomonas fimi TaxID=1708 RepID=UPI00234D13A4|nr:hypothetical protein [Cellulomonas fimi]MDC7122528.1 hypothetical protein [Cellulomonas fimi]
MVERTHRPARDREVTCQIDDLNGRYRLIRIFALHAAPFFSSARPDFPGGYSPAGRRDAVTMA